MDSWRGEYIEALKDRDKYEKRDHELVDAYTRLADHAAALEADKVVQISSLAPNTAARDSASVPPNPELSAQLKSDLAEALRARGQQQSRLMIAETELERLRLKSKSDAKTIKDLYAERTSLMTKVKDRDEELRGKAKLVEEVQDEMLSLNLQLNMTEQRSEKLQQENKDLIDRWMARMGQEADQMNDASKFS